MEGAGGAAFPRCRFTGILRAVRSKVAGTRAWRGSLLSLSLIAVLAMAEHAGAQDLRPEALAAAGTAFREGQSAQLAGDYPRAAELFELADDTAPNPAALRSSIRMRRAAGHDARAATLAAEALARYPEDAETRALAEETIGALSATLGVVHLRCEPACTASIDGRAAHEHEGPEVSLYVSPGAHTLVGAWTGRDTVTERFEVAAGATVELSLTAPEVVVVAEPEPEPEPEPVVTPAPASGITPIPFAVGAGLTAISAGVLIWSGVDVLAARDAYVAAPTRAGYESGVGAETRTNVLIGVTAALAAGTVVLAIFTDFGGSANPEPSADVSAGIDAVTVAPLEGGAAAMAVGHF